MLTQHATRTHTLSLSYLTFWWHIHIFNVRLCVYLTNDIPFSCMSFTSIQTVWEDFLHYFEKVSFDHQGIKNTVKTVKLWNITV